MAVNVRTKKIHAKIKPNQDCIRNYESNCISYYDIKIEDKLVNNILPEKPFNCFRFRIEQDNECI